MVDAQRLGPQCNACGSPTKFTAVETIDSDRDLRTFTCPDFRMAVTYKVENGCLIPEPIALRCMVP